MTTLLTISDKIIYTKYQLDSDNLILNTQGVARDANALITSIPIDAFVVGKSITSNTSLNAPICSATTMQTNSLISKNFNSQFTITASAVTDTVGTYGLNVIGNIKLTSTVAFQRQISASYYNFLSSNGGSSSEGGRIWYGGSSIYFQSYPILGNIDFISRNTSNVDSTRMSLQKTRIFMDAIELDFRCGNGDNILGNPLPGNPSAMKLAADLASMFVELKLEGDSAAKRSFTGCYLKIKDTEALTTTVFQLYQSGVNTYFHNIKTSGVMNFAVQSAAAATVNAIQVQATQAQFNIPVTLPISTGISMTDSSITQFVSAGSVSNSLQNTTMVANSRLTFTAGTGGITQSVTNATATSQNVLKRTTVTTDSGNVNGTATASFVVNDSMTGAGAAGMMVIPNASGGSYSPLVQARDCLITTVLADGLFPALTLALYSPVHLGIRIKQTTVSSVGSGTGEGSVRITAGSGNSLTLSVVSGVGAAALTVPLTMSSSTAAYRNISGVGNLVLLDMSAATPTETTTIDMETTATYPGAQYNCSLASGNHAFICKDGSNVVTAPVVFGSVISSFYNTLSVRNTTTPSNRLDISTNGAQLTAIRARSTTASTNASITLNCDSVDASAVVTNNTIATISNSSFTTHRPIGLNYTSIAGTTLNQLGAIYSTNMANNVFGTSSGSVIRSCDSYMVLYTGTYLVNWSILFRASTTNLTVTSYEFGIATSATTFGTTEDFVVSYIRPSAIAYPTINTTDLVLRTHTSCTMRLTAASIIYFNFYTLFTGGNSTIGGHFSITRIG